MLEQLRRIWPYFKNYRTKALIAFLCSLPISAIKAYQAYLIKPIFDKGLSQSSTFDEAFGLAGLMFGLALVNYPFRFYHFYGMKMVTDKAICAIRSDLFKKFQALPVSYFTNSKSGEMISKSTSDTALFGESFKHCLDFIREPITAIGLLAVAFYHDYQLTLAIFLIFPIFLLVFNLTGKKVRIYSNQVQGRVADMTHDIAEGVYGQKIIKAFNLQDYMRQRFEKSQGFYLGFRRKVTFVQENAPPLVELIGALMFSGIIIFAHHRITRGHLTTGGFISFVGALAMIMDPIRRFSQANMHLNTARAAGDRIFEVLNQDNEKDSGTQEIKEFNQSIEFKNVTFSYGEQNVLSDFNLIIKKGERVGLVGLSGSGKSTLVNLLLRLYPVEQGEILIDGVNINQYSLKSLRDLFALVSQDIFLFNDTVKENILVGNTRSDQEIEHALEVSYAKEFVDKLPQGIETMIGDKGMRLSGGQCQRLTIARAFLINSPIFLFDEATSALDNESEKIVQAALDRIAGQKTVLAVAHRLSTIQDYDKIVVMKDGNKIEEGTHANLLDQAGEYAKLYELSQKS
jgi:subfamily B ATP-binding cassette protein MsbA